eukprot:14781452-Alexandrium_andersonii.AAC.1
MVRSFGKPANMDIKMGMCVMTVEERGDTRQRTAAKPLVARVEQPAAPSPASTAPPPEPACS